MDNANPGVQQPAPQAAPPTGGSNKKLLIIIISAVVGLSILGWVSSFIMGKIASFGVRKAIEAGTGMKIDEAGDTISFKGQDGAEVTFDVNETSGGTVTYKTETGEVGVIETQTSDTDQPKKLPSAFPSDFPVMSGLTLTDSFYIGSGEKNGFTLSWTSKDSQEKAVSFYAEAMPSAGWVSTSTLDMNGVQMLAFEKLVDAEKDTKNTATFTFTPKDDGSLEISLMAEVYK